MMFNSKVVKLVFLLVFVALASACNKGEKFVGKWQKINCDACSVVIVENGKSFLVEIKYPDMSGRISKDSHAAFLQDELLKVNEVLLAIDKSSGQLIFGGDKYVKVNELTADRKQVLPAADIKKIAPTKQTALPPSQSAILPAESFKPEWQLVLTELKDKTNVRSDAKSDAAVVAQLQPGTKVEIETQQGSEWYKVRPESVK